MKRKVLAFVLSMVCIISFAQKVVTKFMGIPVDGTKSEMIKSLKSKGFVYDSANDMFTGTFNGVKSQIFIHTNNDLVDRICVFDSDYINETDIKIRFNKLYRQFANNEKYSTMGDYTIPENENISYEMLVHKKRYESIHYQKLTEEPDSLILSKMEPEMVKVLREKDKSVYEEYKTLDRETQFKILSVLYEALIINYKPVWFMIEESYGKYRINLFYDNEFNRANGEDL